jgi:fluoroacetyl-CoA thioesterase
MRPGLHRGVFAELEVRVAPEMCPHFDGALVHPVYATWTLVYHMELAGRKLLAPHLEQDEEAVGAHISVDHRGMATLGSIVRVRAEVEQCTPRRLTSLMSAYCGPRLLATGTFVQIIMPKHRLEAMIQRHRGET